MILRMKNSMTMISSKMTINNRKGCADIVFKKPR